jgi:meso-butanediol dehydrogenase / (S,S)-butanediol dehydrogenase / diacetyl reductase
VIPATPRLSGAVAIVTGAGQGIGRAAALRLAGEGATIVVAEYDHAAALRTTQAIEAQGSRALARPVDVADVAAVRQLVQEVAGTLGRIDILVNNAGVMQTKPMMELTEGDWDRIVDVNQRGLFFCLQAVAAQMIRQAPAEVKAAGRAPRSLGKIVSLSSVAGRHGRPYATHYAASKAAVISITQSAALALAPYNINVNAICPGIVLTPMQDQIHVDRSRLFGIRPEQSLESYVESIPLKRASVPEDVIGAIAFLCSPDAEYITGQTLNVDGGMEMT